MAASALEEDEPILLAASGGGNSTALALLLSTTAQGQGRTFHACVVDHALRDGSAEDARRATAILKELGAEVSIRTLSWSSGVTPSQAAARRARYAALAEEARSLGAKTVFLGHTCDDQAETTLMRRAAGSGPRGLAAMAPLSPCPVWPEGRDLGLARPLLSARRHDLRDLLTSAGVHWLEDPSNALDRFARVRARAELAASGESEALVALARTHARAAADLDAAALSLLTETAEIADGDAVLRMKPDPADPAHARLVAVLACAIGGAEREPSPASAGRILKRLAERAGGGLAGACFKPGPPIRIQRDPGGLHGRRGGVEALDEVEVPAGVETVWDGRLLLKAEGSGWAAGPSALGGWPALRAGAGRLDSRWLVPERTRQLLWRAGPWRSRKAPTAR